MLVVAVDAVAGGVPVAGGGAVEVVVVLGGGRPQGWLQSRVSFRPRRRCSAREGAAVVFEGSGKSKFEASTMGASEANQGCGGWS